ncbi:MAG: hypothetical protein WAK93_10760 [Solirubrobacteraceae bacterium]
MDLSPYVDTVRRELAVAAEAGGEDAMVLAERLIPPLESGMRLALLDALSAAAQEITRDLAPGSVEVRLRGREPGFAVTPPPSPPRFEDDQSSEQNSATVGADRPGTSVLPVDADERGTARISLRVPEQLKPRIEGAAARAGVSVNAWLVRAASSAVDAPAGNPATGRWGRSPIGQHYKGWVR